jgi:hypothetical protein
MNIGNQLWQEAIKTDLKQFTEYQKFIVLDSGGGYSDRLSENSLPYGKDIIIGPKFGAKLHDKSLIIDKSLYG